jgi:Trk K+ transport system NAD-binding subunit
MVIEHWPFLDAFYMTVITITTVGYREISAVSNTGQIFTILIIFMGVGIIASSLGMVAQTIMRPAVTDFLDLTIYDKDIELTLEDMVVSESSRLKDVALVNSGIRQELNTIIVGIRKRNGEMAFNPSSQTRIEAGDTLIALGQSKDIMQLEKILSGN